MKILICLCLVLSFSNVMAMTRVSMGDTSGSGSESGSRKIQGGDSGDLYSKGEDTTGGGRSIYGEGAGERNLGGAEGGGDSPAHR